MKEIRDNETQEKVIILLSYTVVEPFTVMIEFRNALVALTTVFGFAAYETFADQALECGLFIRFASHSVIFNQWVCTIDVLCLKE